MADGDRDTTFPVTFLPHGERIEVRRGQTVLDAALKAHVDILNGCGGAGACALCEVTVRDDLGPPRVRLACEIEVEAALVVEVR